MEDVGSKVTLGAAWMVGLKWLQKTLGLISTVILARLLMPEDFGLVAMAVTVYALVELIGTFGFDMALIRDHDAKRHHYDTAWTLNLAYRALTGLALLLLAPLIADFFDEPRVTDIIYVYALIILVNGFENIGIVAFRKELTFHKEFIFQFSKKALAVAVTILLAFMLHSYWALVLGTLASAITGAVLSYFMHPFRPGLALSGWRDLFGFSSWVMLNNFFGYGKQRGPDLLIGRLKDAQELGGYRVAAEIALLPTTELYMPIMRAVFPGFSKISHDLPRLRRGYLLAQAMVASVTLPASMGIVVTATPLVWLLLGERWAMIIPLIQVLGIYGMTQVLQGNRYSLFMALGKPYWLTVFVILDLLIMLPLMGYLLYQGYGIEIAVWAKVISSMLLMPLGLIVVARHLEMRQREFSAVVWRPTVATLMMGGLVYFIGQHLPNVNSSFTGGLQLLILIPIGIISYTLVLYILWRLTGRPEGAESRILEVMEGRRGFIARAASVLRGQNSLSSQ